MGIHNVLEAAVWDSPVVFGPNNQKFQEAQELKAAGGGFEISSEEDFATLMNRFVADSQFLENSGHKAGQYVKDKAGATQKVLSSVGL